MKNSEIVRIRKSDLDWLINKTEQYTDRFIEAENFIIELYEMKWYERIFCFNKILNFLKSRKKYIKAKQ